MKGKLVVVALFSLHMLLLAAGLNNNNIQVNKLQQSIFADDTAAKVLIASAQTNTNVSKLEYLCDTYGPRFCGTASYSAALDWILATMKSDGLENVRSEDVVNVTNWVRGQESLSLLSPRVKNMALLGLGNSIGTPGITAAVLVVHSFDELNSRAAEAKGKIVVYNVPFTTYGDTVEYRVLGAIYASQVGAVAALVRSVTPFSLYTPHTGSTRYQTGVKPIPIAAITVEDAELMDRCQARGQQVVVQLAMQAKTMPDVTERNIIAEITGSVYPQQIVLMGGHSDSWDVGQGAMDDGGGLFSAWEALRITLNAIKSGAIPRPKRTIRVVLWTNEELGQRGAEAYRQAHLAELKNHIVAIESDTGNFFPNGFGFTDNNSSSPLLNSSASSSSYWCSRFEPTTYCTIRFRRAATILIFLQTIQQVAQLLAPMGAGNITDDGLDTDNGFLYPDVPCMVLLSDGFDPVSLQLIVAAVAAVVVVWLWFLTFVTVLDDQGLANSVAAFAVMTYYLANM